MRRLFALLIALFCLLSPALAYADGVIVVPEPPICDPGPCPEPRPLFPLAIQYHRVTVTIENQVATTHVDQLFRNDNGFTVEGTYIFPLPAEAAVSEFAMWVDGQKVEGKILSAAEARQVYNDIVRQARDPALLEYVGRGAVQASLFPIPSGQTRRIELEYSQVLPLDNGLVHYRYPLNTEKFSTKPLEQVSISVKVNSPQRVHAIYSPSHALATARDGDYRFTAGYEANTVIPNTDFDLYYSVATDNLGANLLTYRDPATGEGYFLLLAAPALNAEANRVIAKDVIVVLDQSGSMQGEKFQQAQTALKYVLNHLNAEDRFNLIAFSTDLKPYAPTLRPANEAAEAARWVDALNAEGSTDINRALLEALSLSGDTERPTFIIFLTDGLPTVGEVEPDHIIANLAQANAPAKGVRLFNFGVGDDVDTRLLDTLAEQNHGATAYVRPGERLDEAISGFYAKVSTPVLSNLVLDFGSVTVNALYPDPLPDLFAGSQLIVAGRYQNPGSATLTVKGTVNGAAQTFTFPDQNFRAAGGDDFIPRLWATRRLGYLLNQIRLHGENKELIDEIVKLSVRHGIVTPYTSYLVTEANILSEEGRRDVADEVYAQAAAASPEPSSGAGAVDKSVAQSNLAQAEAPVAPADAYANVVRAVGQRTFLFSNGVWIDTAFDTRTMTATPVQFASAGYFDLLAARPELAAPFALGARVIALTDDGRAYEVTDQAGAAVTPPPTYTPGVMSTPGAPATPIAAVTLPSVLPTPVATPTLGVTPPDGPLPTQLSPTPTRGGSGGPCASAYFFPALIAVPFLLRRKK